MTLEEFVAKWPHLSKTIDFVAEDNNYHRTGEINLPIYLEAVLSVYEDQANKLSDEEKRTIASGEDYEREELTARTHTEALDDFISEVFEGVYQTIFW
jgi:hypothetical protein